MASSSCQGEVEILVRCSNRGLSLWKELIDGGPDITLALV